MTEVSKPILVLVFDTMCLSAFARADRLDVLRDLVVDRDCWSTRVVVEELRNGVKNHPELARALDLDWLSVVNLDTFEEIKCFVKWTSRIGSGDRDIGEASVLAAAELRGGIAVTDDRDAVRVARSYRAEVHGMIWLLANACRAGKMTLPGAAGLVEALRSVGLRLPCTGAEFPEYAQRNGLLHPPR